MRHQWPATAVELQSSVRALLHGLGGIDLTREVESQPALRGERLLPALDRTGVLDLDPLGDEEESAAAALAVHACGEVVAPLPVTRMLSVPAPERDRLSALYVVDGQTDVLDHADLFDGRGVTATLDAGATPQAVRAVGQRRHAPLDPFGVPVRLEGPVDVDLPERALQMSFVLDAFWVAGALATVVQQTAEYTTTRRQFGRPIGVFGEIKWRLADMAVAHDGLEALAAYTWFLVQRGRATLADVLAVRVGTIEAADTVVKNGHQVFGAVGLCEEHDLTVIDRHLTPVLLRPTSAGRTAVLLLDAVNRLGFDGTYPVPPRAPAEVAR